MKNIFVHPLECSDRGVSNGNYYGNITNKSHFENRVKTDDNCLFGATIELE